MPGEDFDLSNPDYVTCNPCGFTFAKDHVDENGIYTCPVCAESHLTTKITKLEVTLKDVAKALTAACRLQNLPARDGNEASMNEHVRWAGELVRRALGPIMTIHELKTWPAEFAAVRSGKKKYEIRKNDRNFKVGDGLLLKEWDPNYFKKEEVVLPGYTGEWERRGIAYITPGGQWGLPPDLCVLGFE